ncbi:MAG: SDR family oxidoreductase [Nitrospirae bacterium]|nr:SDR family oxidoreductase [Nitrospirota bacterium]
MPDIDIIGIKGKTALVSGSTRGVGFAVAALLARAGARVVLNYHNDSARADVALYHLKEAGAEAIAVRADVSREEDALRLVQEAVTAFGPIDILVNNAHGRIIREKFGQTDWATHQSHIDGIVKGAYHLSCLVLEGMKERGWGRIVNIGNNMLTQPITGYSGLTAAMGALFGLTRNLAAEVGPYGVTVNIVSPGFVMTEEAPHTNEAVLAAIKAATPLGRLAAPDDIAGAVLFFCSDLGRFVTGANLSVDGGKIMG